jgi:hypothetical protein
MEITFRNTSLERIAAFRNLKIDYDQDLGWAWINLEVDISYSIFSVKRIIETQDNDFRYFLNSLIKLNEGVIKRAHFSHLDGYLQMEVCRDHPSKQMYLGDDNTCFIIFSIHDDMCEGNFQFVQVIDRGNISDLINQFENLLSETKKHYEDKD